MASIMVKSLGSLKGTKVSVCPIFKLIIIFLFRDGWWLNYLFKPNGEAVGCIQLNAANNLARANLLLTAYLTNALVKIQVKNNHEVGGIAHGN